jgi:hypothetical protein
MTAVQVFEGDGVDRGAPSEKGYRFIFSRRIIYGADGSQFGHVAEFDNRKDSVAYLVAEMLAHSQCAGYDARALADNYVDARQSVGELRLAKVQDIDIGKYRYRLNVVMP